MPEFTLSLHYSNKAYRIAVSALFFFQGLCFTTWASRIPSIQHNLQLSDATLGLILFALPFGSMIALPISGWAVIRYGSKRVATNAILLYRLILAGLGLAQNVLSLVCILVVYGMAGLLIASGLMLAVILPNLLFSITGFFLVGLGVSSVIPLVYSEAGRSKTLSPGVALATVSSIKFLGFLIGPPLIGIVSGLFSLRVAFMIIAAMGFSILIVSRKLEEE